MSDHIQRNGWLVWHLISSVAKIQEKNIYNYICVCIDLYIPTKLNLPCFHHYCPSYELGLSYSTHIFPRWIPNCPSLSAPFAQHNVHLLSGDEEEVVVRQLLRV
jgi:hypothetical protein